MARAVLLLSLTGLLLLFGACGGGDDDSGSALADAGQPGRGDRVDEAQPPGTDPQAVQPYIEDLLVRHDEVVNQVVADFSVAEERDDPLIQQFVDLFEPDSAYAEAQIDAWREKHAEGVSVQPFSDDHPAKTSSLDGGIETVSEDEVRFTICDELRHEIYDRDGALLERLPYFDQSGTAVAVRVDGEWRLRSLASVEGALGCGDEAR